VNNLAENLIGECVQVSPEWIIAQDPEIIIKTGGIDRYSEIMNRQGFDQISAVRNERVYVLNSSLIYGPRDVIGRVYLAKIFYPDLFSDISPDQILDEYAGEFVPGANKTCPVYPPIT
jgi:iron complex transport system substrate-binding protein